MPFSTDISVSLSEAQTRTLGRLLQKLKPLIENLLDPLYFPSETDEPEDITRFFFFMTSIDHRTSPPGESFEGFVGGQYFQGADLLWHLGLQEYQRDPEFFSPENMSKISTSMIRKWLTVNEPLRVTIRNPAERAELLRDGGHKLLEKYNGLVLTLLEQANHRLCADAKNQNLGFLDLLNQFRAYEDPASKKSLLLLKFLLRRNLWTLQNPEKLRIPVDNHLTRIAIRNGTVTISSEFETYLRNQEPISRSQDVELRKGVARAYNLVAQYAQRSVFELDDFFWHFGRQCCLANAPVCNVGCTDDCYASTKLLQSPCQRKCPLRDACLAYQDIPRRSLIEPKVVTWYY